MINLSHLIHWEKFRDQGSFAAFERYASDFFQYHADLLDLQSLNLDSCGPALSELPSDTLPTLSKTLQIISQQVDQGNGIQKITELFKFLCILARKPSNLDGLYYSEIIKFSYVLAQLSIDKLLQENKEDVAIWLDSLNYILYFLECLYDPTFCWRRWKKSIYTRMVVSNPSCYSEPLPVTPDVIPWFCDNLRSLSGDRDLKGRVMHLFSAAISGSKCNSQLLICPATVDAFQVENCTTTEAVVSFACLVKHLSSIKKSERQEELTVVLLHLIAALTLRNQINLIEIICLYRLTVCGSEIADTLIQCQGVKLIGSSLAQNNEAISETVVNILRCLTQPATREKFCLFKGYRIILDALNTISPVPDFLYGQLLRWIIGEPFHASHISHRTYRIRDGAGMCILVEWCVEQELAGVTVCSSVPPGLTPIRLLDWLTQLAGLCRSNLTECGSSGLLPCLANQVHRICSATQQHTGQSQSFQTLLSHILKLMEVVGSHSVSADDLIALLQLLRQQNVRIWAGRIIQILSNMAANCEAHMLPSHWLELTGPEDGLIVCAPPEDKVENLSSPTGPDLDVLPFATSTGFNVNNLGFTFHTWLCLDPLSMEERTRHERRQIFRLISQNGSGFEAFFTQEHQLMLATCIAGEYQYVQVGSPVTSTTRLGSHPVSLEKWHMLDIVFLNAKRIFSNASVSVFLNGNHIFSKEIKYPKMSDKIALFHIGGCPVSLYSPFISTLYDSLSRSRRRGPSLFSGSGSHVNSIIIGGEHLVWGKVTSLKGQMVCALGFDFALSDQAIKEIYMKGVSDYIYILKEETLSSKLLFYYHAKACTNRQAVDLASLSSHRYATLTSTPLSATRFAESICQVGGVSALLPILEEIDEWPITRSLDAPGDEEADSFVLILNKASESVLNESALACFVNLLRHLLSNDTNQNHLLHTQAIASLGVLLQNVPAYSIDEHLITALQILVDVCQVELRHQLFKYILFDWRIWSRCDLQVRTKHIDYVASIVHQHRSIFRESYGLRFFLDVIRTFHEPSQDTSSSCYSELRHSLMGMIRTLIYRHTTHKDLEELLHFINASQSNELIQLMIGLLSRLFRESDKNDQATRLMYEKGLIETLYALLIKFNVTIKTKEVIIEFINMLVMSDRVSDKYKGHLLLEETGFAGLFAFNHFSSHEFTITTTTHLLDILRKAASKDLFGVAQFLALLSFSPTHHKMAAISLFHGLLNRSGPATLAIAIQPSWHDLLLHLLIKQARPNLPKKISTVSMVALTTSPPSSDVRASRRSLSESFSTKEEEEESPRRSVMRSNTLMFIEDNFSDHDGISESGEDVVNQSGDDIISTGSYSSDAVKEVSDLEETGDLSLGSASKLPSTSSSCDIFSNVLSSELTSLSARLSDEEEIKLSEQTVELTLSCLQKIMWEGIQGSDRNSWIQRHQVFECLRNISERYELLQPFYSIKQRLLVLLVEKWIQDCHTFGLSKVLSENAEELIGIIVDTVCTSESVKDADYSAKLLEVTSSMLVDHLCVWEEGLGWGAQAASGIYLLLTWAGDPSPDIAAPACARLHHVITSLTHRQYDEAAYILARLHDVILRVEEENFCFVAPVLKTLLDRFGDLLQSDSFLSDLPVHSETFYDDFKSYAKGPQWKHFLSDRITSAVEIYESKFLNKVTTDQSLFRAEAHGLMLQDRSSRQRQLAGFKSRFDTDILSQCHGWPAEEARYQRKLETRRHQRQRAALRHWRNMRQCLTGPRGPWGNPNDVIRHFKLSNRENHLRMRPKMEPNYNFDPHLEAVHMRDHPNLDMPPTNLSVTKQDGTEGSTELLGALEGRIDLSQIGDDQVGDDEWFTQDTTNDEEAVTNKHKSIFTVDCELITLMDRIQGVLELSSTHLSFTDTSENNQDHPPFAKDPDNSEFVKHDLRINVAQLKEIHLRRYNLRRSAIEIFLIDQTNYFFNFEKATRNKVYSKILSLRLQNLIYIKSRSPGDVLKQSSLIQKWVSREISNFEYLMHLNTIAGRTYNDLSQYPVFPWILADYTSPSLNLEDERSFRDLSRPIGIANPTHIEAVREKFDNFEDPSGTMHKFHYGTHYSSAAGIMHYLVRTEPFTQLHIQLQSGKFDAADRQFFSISRAWQLIMENPSDNRELIPEFFYFPDFLINSNDFDLGTCQFTRERVHDVILPNWATSAEDFIHKHRLALESDFVSEHLHHWIDLIFGYKQKGKAAEEALNVFSYVTYEGAVDLDEIENLAERQSIESMINNFGQTPCQLLQEPHPQRMTREKLTNSFILTGRPLPILDNFENLQHQSCDISSSTNPQVFVCLPRNQARGFMLQEKPMVLITVSQNGLVGIHSWTALERAGQRDHEFEPDQTLKQTSGRRKACLGTLMPGLVAHADLYTCSSDASIMYAAGQWDNTIVVYNLRSRSMYRLKGHSGVITCLCKDMDSHLMAGSRDTTGSLWKLDPNQILASSDIGAPVLVQTYLGQRSPVTTVALCMALDLAITGGRDGRVNLHAATTGQLLHCLQPSSPLSTVPALAYIYHVKYIPGSCYSLVQWEESEGNCQMLSLYSINGRHVLTQSLAISDRITCIIFADQGQQVILGTQGGSIIFKDVFYFTTKKTLNFNKGIMALWLTQSENYLFTSLKDGKLVITKVKYSANCVK